jgi:hypothetical protein
MKNFVRVFALFTVTIFCFSGCGKKSENVSQGNPVAGYPLPDPPLLADCSPGIPGGRLIVSGQQDVDIQAAKKSALERRTADHG